MADTQSRICRTAPRRALAHALPRASAISASESCPSVRGIGPVQPAQGRSRSAGTGGGGATTSGARKQPLSTSAQQRGKRRIATLHGLQIVLDSPPALCVNFGAGKICTVNSGGSLSLFQRVLRRGHGDAQAGHLRRQGFIAR